jgi:hypothetical protein
MANLTGPYGLRPLKHLDGSKWDGALVRCYVSASYATALFVGDPVLLSPTLAEKDTTGRYPTINKSAGTTGTLVPYVIMGFEVNPDDLTKIYNPASTEAIALCVRCADDLIFTIRGDGGGTPSKVFPGQNAVMIATTAGSTSTGLSGMHLDEGTTTAPTTTQAFPLHILGINEVEDNTLADNAEWQVLINTNNNATGRILGVTAS